MRKVKQAWFRAYKTQPLSVLVSSKGQRAKRRLNEGFTRCPLEKEKSEEVMKCTPTPTVWYERVPKPLICTGTTHPGIWPKEGEEHHVAPQFLGMQQASC